MKMTKRYILLFFMKYVWMSKIAMYDLYYSYIFSRNLIEKRMKNVYINILITLGVCKYIPRVSGVGSCTRVYWPQSLLPSSLHCLSSQHQHDLIPLHPRRLHSFFWWVNSCVEVRLWMEIWGTGGLQLEDLSSPAHLVLGQPASLDCDYRLGNSSLYSVKWYKDGEEFFRFMPSMLRSFEVFHVAGVSLDVRKRNLGYNHHLFMVLAGVQWQQESLPDECQQRQRRSLQVPLTYREIVLTQTNI